MTPLLTAPARHIVAMSGGKDSTAMALRLRELHPDVPYEYVITPTGDELPPMIEHWNRLQEILGPFTALTCGASLEGLIEQQRALPNWRARWCTRMLKIEPFHAYLESVAPCVSYVGLRADEAGRAGMEFKSRVSGVDIKFPMQAWGWGIGEVFGYLAERGISIPARTDCGACFYQTVREWWELHDQFPDRYQRYIDIEATVSEQRGKPCTLRSDGRDTWPASLAALRDEFRRGRVPKGAGQGELFRDAMCRTCSL